MQGADRKLDPFVGESSGTVLVPQAVVEAIDDPELRRMYLDFCPLIDELLQPFSDRAIGAPATCDGSRHADQMGEQLLDAPLRAGRHTASELGLIDCGHQIRHTLARSQVGPED